MNEEREDAARRLWRLWQEGRPPDLAAFLLEVGPLGPVDLAEVLCVDQRQRWLLGQPLPAEHYLRAHPVLTADEEAAFDLVYAEYCFREEQGEAVAPEEYLQRFPQFADKFRLQFQVRKAIEDDPRPTPADGPTPPAETRPELPIAPLKTAEVVFHPPPQRIGRYRVVRLLGKGAFGRVYLARDDELGRPVAIKVPHAQRVFRPQDVEAYLAEARTLAGLDHPHIVPVHDVGRTDDGLCYVVSKFIEGSDLEQKLQQSRSSYTEAAGLAAAVAEALHHAHHKGLVHRDVKPANILLDANGKPYLADFGLALKEEDLGRGSGFAGTPAYMSPEQARGEGHRVDGRSDVFSLGVVLYELLTGRRPFRGETRNELLEQIVAVEARPPRQVHDTIPKELERICLKALAKRASERYTTAWDMADDLRHFLGQAASKQSAEQVGVPAAPPTPGSDPRPTPTPVPPSSDRRPLRIVPKGLRSFDADDADFFLELLPGPRDRDGLPDGIRFWKRRIEETDADQTFAVGLIYGPSGCGKSSLVKAGLLPRLAKAVTAVYIEATADETEARLLRGLRRQVPDLPGSLGLIEALAALRQGRFLASAQKVLLVLDQFEQWLHAKRNQENTELVQALRQCDGGRVQCIVLVRDDFWMAATRFMRDVEIRLVEGQNSAAVDLFPMRHAEKVLTAFGRAFGALPDGSTEASKDQKQFLEQAVSGLAQDGKIICVRLALFAEMMKGKPWTTATLKEVGGAEGVGVTFLEETFSAATAPPEHRYHQKAARAVLKCLLPESGADIKGHMRSHAELLQASGYANRPKDFDDLLRILDSEIRLLTPTDPEGQEEDAVSQVQTGQKYYQLTHDYLVPSLREWLTRKQKETRRGRAEIRLAERAAAWNAKPERRHLPAWWEWLNIHLFTRKRDWTPPQRKMMRQAARYHAERGVLLALLFVVLTGVGLEILFQIADRNRADNLVLQLLDADISRTPDLFNELDGRRYWAEPRLRDAWKQAAQAGDAPRQLRASLALLSADPDKVDYLYGRFLDAEPAEAAVILRRLAETGHLAANQGHGAALLNETVTQALEAAKTEPDKEALAKRQANAAVALLRMGQTDPVWPLLKRTPPDDPRVRSYLIHRLYPLGADARAILKHLDEEPDVTIRRALLLSLGEYDEKELSPEARQAELPTLQEIYRKDDPGLHAASEWLLRTWKQEAWLKQMNDEWAKDQEQREKRLDDINQLLTKDKEKTPPQWYVNGQGQTMVVIPGPVEFVIGSPTTEVDRQIDETQHKKRISRTIVLAAKSVTVEQYRQFDKGYKISEQYTRTADLPVVGIDWYMAAKYCNWLSNEEGIPEGQRCYEIKGDETKLKANYLSLTGYRLPTEAEMEVATRAGALTSRYYGETEELLWKYAWYLKNSKGQTWPVGSLKPNDLGLFDVQGNVYTWCQESYQDYPATKDDEVYEDKEDGFNIVPSTGRVLRGGSFMVQASSVRSAGRDRYAPTNRFSSVGFRPARTFR